MPCPVRDYRSPTWLVRKVIHINSRPSLPSAPSRSETTFPSFPEALERLLFVLYSTCTAFHAASTKPGASSSNQEFAFAFSFVRVLIFIVSLRQSLDRHTVHMSARPDRSGYSGRAVPTTAPSSEQLQAYLWNQTEEHLTDPPHLSEAPRNESQQLDQLYSNIYNLPSRPAQPQESSL